MREIKFRAWIPAAKEWLNDVSLKDVWQSGRALGEFGLSRYESENIQGAGWKFDDLIFMQSTGLKGKNGKEVYEGDIVRWAAYPSGTYTYAVRWVSEYAMFLPNNINEDVEIIGNIYEHPGLVEK